MYQTALDLAHAHVSDLCDLLDEMGARGIRLDREALDKFNLFLDSERERLEVEINAQPDVAALGGFHPPAGYKKTLTIKCSHCNGKGRFVSGRGKAKVVTECCCCHGAKRLLDEDKILRENITFQPSLQRWAKQLPFIPTSPKKVIKYSKMRGHVVKINAEGNETAQEKDLLKAWRKYDDENYKRFVDYRKIVKLRSVYGNWPSEQREDGHYYIRTHFTLRPDTGRLSAENPNIQQLPKRGKLAKEFKKCLIARPGNELVAADLESAEAVILGWLTGDPLLLRLARLGMHKYAMARKLGLQVDMNKPDSELKKFFDELKERDEHLYHVLKTTVYGSFYLAGPRTLFERNPEDFSSQKEAKDFQAVVFGAIPQIKRWQNQMTQQLPKYDLKRRWGWVGNRLINPWGYSKEFWDMRGGDGPAACAFIPQSTIASLMKDAMLQTRRDWLDGRRLSSYLIWQKHDELVWDVPKGLVESTRVLARANMGRAWPQLNGLQLGVDIKSGKSLAEC